MPPFNAATAAIHYGDVVHGSLKASMNPATQEASTISLLLFDTEAAEKRHTANIQAEHEKFEQEALEIRRVKHALHCIKILLFFSVLPNLLWVTVLTESILVVGLMILSVVALCRSFSAIPAFVVWAVVFLNSFSLYFIYLEGCNDWVVGPFGFVNAATLVQDYRHCRSKRDRPLVEQGNQRQKERFLFYMGTIRSVAKNVCNPSNNSSQQSTELREFFTSSPPEGFYEDPRNGSQLFLLFPPCESPDKGWSIRGVRKVEEEGRVQSLVLEGFVSPTHEAYWTEGTLDGKENTLYYGTFNQNKFSGEWLSHKEKRCHDYELSLSSAADPEEHFGAVCDECNRNALPGMCYTAKDRNCYYCEGCVENSDTNDSNLVVKEEEFVAFHLPEVGRQQEEDQRYAPPDNSDVDLEAGVL